MSTISNPRRAPRRINIDLPPELGERVEAAAAERRWTLSVLVREALEAFTAPGSGSEIGKNGSGVTQ